MLNISCLFFPRKFIKLVDAYKSLEHVRHKVEDLTKERDDLDIEVAGLKSRVNLLEGQLKVMEGVNKEKHDLEEKVIELKGHLAEYDKVVVEKVSLEKNLKAITDLLNERVDGFRNIIFFYSDEFLCHFKIS